VSATAIAPADHLPLPLSAQKRQNNHLQKLNKLTNPNLHEKFHIPTMCLLPCWPFNGVYLEKEPRKKNKKEEGVLVYDPKAKSVVKITGSVPVSSFSSCFGI
jgi:hypothetical protein